MTLSKYYTQMPCHEIAISLHNNLHSTKAPIDSSQRELSKTKTHLHWSCVKHGDADSY